jgi:hypothetical protein
MDDDSTFLTRVLLKNYKSIGQCSITLRPLTFLVGPNGAGKSNFLDALRFVADALRTSLDHALRERGGIKEVRRRSGGHPTHFAISLEFSIRPKMSGHYAFRIGARPSGGYEVQDEECEIHYEASRDGPSRTTHFKVRDGKVTSSLKVVPAASSDRLYLVNAGCDTLWSLGSAFEFQGARLFAVLEGSVLWISKVACSPLSESTPSRGFGSKVSRSISTPSATRHPDPSGRGFFRRS